MQKLNFKKLMESDPFIYHEFTNVKGQKILLVEHPYQGDEYPVIIIFPVFEKAFCSEFYDCDDLIGYDGYIDYQPIYDEQKNDCFSLWELSTETK